MLLPSHTPQLQKLGHARSQLLLGLEKTPHRRPDLLLRFRKLRIMGAVCRARWTRRCSRDN
jgi:hypothetical protein